MSILLCDSTGDLSIVNNQLQLTDGQQEVLQLIRNNLRTFQGEEPLNTLIGVPWFQQILQKQTPLAISQQILEQVVTNTPGVIQVLNFTLTVDVATRKATLVFSVKTETGVVTSTETFP